MISRLLAPWLSSFFNIIYFSFRRSTSTCMLSGVEPGSVPFNSSNVQHTLWIYDT